MMLETDRYAGGLESALQSFNPAQLSVILKNVQAIELTEGCSTGCDFCGFDIPIGVRDRIPYPLLEIIARELGKVRKGEKVNLYHRSEPLDYLWEDKNVFDVLRLFRENDLRSEIFTSVPKGKEEFAISNRDEITRISISHVNRNRLRPFFDRLGVDVWVYVADLKRWPNYPRFPLGNSEELAKIASETGVDIPQLDTIPFFDINKQTANGIYADIASTHKPHYFLFCTQKNGSNDSLGRIHQKNSPRSQLYERVIDIDFCEIAGKLENGLQTEQVSRTGRLYDGSSKNPFGCLNGVLITQRGFFNMHLTETSEQNRTGQVVEPITPHDFKVVKRDAVGFGVYLPELRYCT